MGRTELMGRAVRSAESDWNVELPARHRKHVRRVVHDLVEGDKRKTKSHELDDWPQADHRRANAKTGKTIFADRRVDDARRSEGIEQTLDYFVSAVVLVDFLA